jgi:hypothetical protein
MEVAVQLASLKSLLENMCLKAATRNLKGDDDVYKPASRNTLGGLLVHIRFFDAHKKAFTKEQCFMAIALSSTGVYGTAITLTITPDEVVGGDKLLHFWGLPVTNTGEDLVSPVYGTVSSEFL